MTITETFETCMAVYFCAAAIATSIKLTQVARQVKRLKTLEAEYMAKMDKLFDDAKAKVQRTQSLISAGDGVVLAIDAEAVVRCPFCRHSVMKDAVYND